MKKLICLLLLSSTLLTALSLSACTNNRSGDTETTTDGTEQGDPTNTPSENDSALASLSLQEIFDAIKVPDTVYPGLREEPLEDDEVFELHFGIQRPEGLKESLLIVPNISSIPFEIGLLRFEEGVDEAALAKKIDEALAEKQWICGQPSLVKAIARGNVILLVVEGEDARGEAMINAFNAL